MSFFHPNKLTPSNSTIIAFNKLKLVSFQICWWFFGDFQIPIDQLLSMECDDYLQFSVIDSNGNGWVLLQCFQLQSTFFIKFTLATVFTNCLDPAVFFIHFKNAGSKSGECLDTCEADFHHNVVVWPNFSILQFCGKRNYSIWGAQRHFLSMWVVCILAGGSTNAAHNHDQCSSAGYHPRLWQHSMHTWSIQKCKLISIFEWHDYI